MGGMTATTSTSSSVALLLAKALGEDGTREVSIVLRHLPGFTGSTGLSRMGRYL